MNNIMTIDGRNAVIRFDPDSGLFRGEFVGLNGGADFYAQSVSKLRSEGAKSLRVFLDTCREQGMEPFKSYSGKFQVRVPEDLHARASEAAAAEGVSLNQLIQRAIEHEVSA